MVATCGLVPNSRRPAHDAFLEEHDRGIAAGRRAIRGGQNLCELSGKEVSAPLPLPRGP